MPERSARRTVYRLLRWVLALALIAAAAFWIARRMSRPPEVEAAAVRRGPVERTLAVVGRLEPEYVNDVVPLMPGRLVDLPRREGDRIEKGDLLARIDDREAGAALQQAEAALAAEREDLQQARRDLAREQELFRAGLVAQSNLEQKRLAVERGEAQVRQAAERIEEARARRSQYVLRAPFAGYVLQRPVDPGQNVTLQTVLYRIATSEGSLVEAEIDEQYLSELRLGLPAVVAPSGGRGQAYPASIAYIARQVDSATGAATVRFRLDTGGAEVPELPAGLSFDVNVRVAEHPAALTVPREAVSGLGDRPWVLLVRDGQPAERQEVQVIDWPAARIVVTGGLQEGDRVALSPRAVPPGTVVRVRDAV